jgi:glycosyltransferase involved in cell wall biosynthesis
MPNHFPLEGSGSGIYTLNVALELAKAQHEVLVIVPDHYPVHHESFPVRTILFRGGENKDAQLDFDFPTFTTHPRSTSTFYELTDTQIQSYVDAWHQAITTAVRDFQPDVIHAHHVWVIPFAAQKTGLPYVISCHGTDLMGFQEGPRYREMALSAAAGAHAVIAISRQVQTDAMRIYDLPANRVPLIGNGYGADIFMVIPDATKMNVLKEFGLNGAESPLVSFVGKLTNFKGVDVLMKAAAIYERKLDGVQTLLVGQGQLWDDLHQMRSQLGLKGVHFLGHQPQTKVARIYNAADVSVVPSRVEPFGLVAIEALACGTPVVATNEGGLPDFINDRVGTLVPVDDHVALAEALISEITMNTKRTKGSFASQYAQQGYTWTEQVAKMVNLYEGAIREN